MSATPRRLSRRPSRTIPATLLAIVLVAAGGLGLWLLVTLIATGSWPSEASPAIGALANTRLDSPAAATTAGVLGALGLLMLIAGTLAGRRSKIAILGGGIPGETVIGHRDLARRIRLRTERADGVHSTTVQIRPRRAEVTVRTVVEDPSAVRQATKAAADQAVAELQPASRMRTRVRIQRMK